jgi:radical SAM-linked protein
MHEFGRPRTALPLECHATSARRIGPVHRQPRLRRARATIMTQATKVRLRFAKCGDLRLVSHHDLMRCLERMLRRAAVPVALSQGFNRRPKVTFALALGLGIEGCSEVVDLELSRPLEPAQLLAQLRGVAPAGFEWNNAIPLPPNAPPPRPRTVEYCFPVGPDRRADAQRKLGLLLDSPSWPFERRRPKGVSTFDLRPHLVGAELSAEGLLRFRLKVSPDGSARPEELLEALALRDLLDHGAVLVRTEIDLDS